MKIRSLGWKTEIKIRSLSGEVLERRGYLAIRTASNPGFIWGNFLFLPEAPSLKELPLWREKFASEFNGIKHAAFSWDTPVPEARLKPYAKKGFLIENSFALKRSRKFPQKSGLPSLLIKEIRLNKDWEQIPRNYLESGEERTPERTAFVENLFLDYRRVAQAGYGGWFGAYLGGRLIGSLGILPCDTIGRFQEVFVHKDFRRRGIAMELIKAASNTAFTSMKLKQLVIVADKNTPAEKLYRKLGFTQAGREQGIFLKN